MSELYDATYKVILFGDEGVGKRTLCRRYESNIFRSDTIMTIGVDFLSITFEINEKKIKMQIFLFSGRKRFRFLLPTYARGANGALFLYDITNYSSLKHLDEWLSLIKKKIKKEDLFPIIVVGNKADLTEEREVKGEDGIEFAKSRGIDGFIECNAKTGENVEEVYRTLAILMMQKFDKFKEKKTEPKVKKLRKKSKKKRKIKTVFTD